MNQTAPLAIDVHGLCKSFGKKEVVHNLALQVRTGEIFGFLGPNGSGKTTTIRMLCGLLKPSAGSGTCLGYDIINESLIIKTHVGYMTQRFSLYEDLSIRENLEFIARVYKLKNRTQRINESLDRLKISKERAHQLAGQLSGGWKQRLALAAAMLHEPQLLLLDEPTAGVDPEARRSFWEEIHNLSTQGITTLVSTHYMDEAERCHRLAYIAFGHLLTTGSIPDVIKDAGLHLWIVKGDDLHTLAEKLRLDPAITHVTAFGQTLHVVGTDAAMLEQAIQPYQNNHYQWKQAPAELEDVFIHLVSTAKNNHG
ncbi:MAG: ABC transporter ATP-binding protein [Pseudomonadota bacterium]|nr:ABC transporter ATP-binding protein [Gammaproteobacteria bacterium]